MSTSRTDEDIIDDYCISNYFTRSLSSVGAEPHTSPDTWSLSSVGAEPRNIHTPNSKLVLWVSDVDGLGYPAVRRRKLRDTIALKTSFGPRDHNDRKKTHPARFRPKHH